MRALTDSMALVVHTTRRISVSNGRNGTNSAQAFSQSRTIAGYLAPHSSWNSRNRSSAAFRGRSGVDRLEGPGGLVPVLAGRVTKRRPHQVNHAGLGDRLRPDRADRVRQALQAVTHDHAHVLDAPSVSTWSQYLAPSPPSAGPQANDVAGPIYSDGRHHIDRPVRDLPVPHLDVQRSR